MSKLGLDPARIVIYLSWSVSKKTRKDRLAEMKTRKKAFLFINSALSIMEMINSQEECTKNAKTI